MSSNFLQQVVAFLFLTTNILPILRAEIIDDGTLHVRNDPNLSDFVGVLNQPATDAPTTVEFGSLTNITAADVNDDSVYVEGTSTVTIDGGSFAVDISAYESGNLNINGGTVGRDVFSFDQSNSRFTGGAIARDLVARHQSDVEISGGTIGRDLFALEQANVEIIDGTISNDLIARNQAIVTFMAGVIQDDVEAFNGSQVRIDGGTVGDDVEAVGSSRVTINGGTFGEDIEAIGGTIDIFGGTFYDSPDFPLTDTFGFHATDGPNGTLGTLTLYGHSFMVDTGSGFMSTVGPLTSASGDIMGTLADGSQFLVPFDANNGGMIQLVAVPEPSSAILFSALGAAFSLRRRARHA